MILAADIGNTTIKLGLFSGGRLAGTIRVETSGAGDEGLSAAIGRLLEDVGTTAGELTGVAACTVVPGLKGAFSEAVEKAAGLEAEFVGEGELTGMPVLTDNPSEVGPDRIATALAAYRSVGGAAVAVDLGTAVTVDFVNGRGEFAGGAISAGLDMMAEALSEKTAVLSRISPREPERAIGRTTVEAMNSGLFYGFVGMVDAVVEKVVKEAGPVPVISTGGAARLVSGKSRFIKEPDEHLTLKGVRIIYEEKTR